MKRPLYFKLLFLSLAMVAASSGTAISATFYSPIWSLNRIVVPANSDQWVGPSGSRAALFRGEIATASSTAVTLSASSIPLGDLAPTGPHGSCYLKVLTGNAEGACYPITNDGASGLVLGFDNNTPGTIAVAPGDHVAVVPYWTTSTLVSNPTDRTEVRRLGRNTPGINGGALNTATYYDIVSGWYIGVTLADDISLKMDEVVVLRNPSATPFIHSQAGEISMTQHYRNLTPQLATGQDHKLVYSGATEEVLGDLGFNPSDGDEVFFFDLAEATFNKGFSRSARYYASVDGWYIGITPVDLSEEILPGCAFVYRQAPGNPAQLWQDLPNYL